MVSDACDFEDLLEQLGDGSMISGRRDRDAVMGVTVDDVRRADHQMGVQSLERIYRNTVKKVGDQLTNGSVKHLIAGLAESIVDGYYALSPPLEKVAQSPFVEGLKQTIGSPDASVGDLLLEALRSSNVPVDLVQEAENTIDAVSSLFQRSELRSQTIADYCNEHNTTPEKVLRSPKAMMNVVETVYGSLEVYGQAVLESTITLGEFSSTLAAAFIEDTLETKLGPGAAAALNIDANALGNVVGNYVRDVTLFASMYLLEMAEENAKDLGRYMKVMAGRK